MSTDKPYLQHLSSCENLVTTYDETRAAFVAQALEKTRRAVPYVAEARALKFAASKAQNPRELLSISGIQAALASAAGISDKGEGHFPPEAKTEAIQLLIEKHLEPAGKNFVEELVFRFLLTKGDALGGSMRNWIGAFAQRKITRAVISILKNSGNADIFWLTQGGKTWSEIPNDDADIELAMSGLSWTTKERSRTIVFNRKPRFVGKNLDLCLLGCDHEACSGALETPGVYIAIGELKGGIDPAGADEHWKTANTALDRVRRVFVEKGLSPKTFFVGAAIESSMAREIWDQLEHGELSNAANLTDFKQLSSVCEWICSL